MNKFKINKYLFEQTKLDFSFNVYFIFLQKKTLGKTS